MVSDEVPELVVSRGEEGRVSVDVVFAVLNFKAYAARKEQRKFQKEEAKRLEEEEKDQKIREIKERVSLRNQGTTNTLEQQPPFAENVATMEVQGDAGVLNTNGNVEIELNTNVNPRLETEQKDLLGKL